ncbi:MAG: hypothetical protein SGJ18_15850 [Pseudomonadota bacterium]|nr:hypothetical protein [Pseudomonadota bacterium]
MTIKNLITTTRRALRGENHDYTQGDISEAVILLAIPMILELSLESVFALVDIWEWQEPTSQRIFAFDGGEP